MDKLRSIAVDINQQLHRPHLLYDECFNGIAYDEELGGGLGEALGPPEVPLSLPSLGTAGRRREVRPK